MPDDSDDDTDSHALYKSWIAMLFDASLLLIMASVAFGIDESFVDMHFPDEGQCAHEMFSGSIFPAVQAVTKMI